MKLSWEYLRTEEHGVCPSEKIPEEKIYICIDTHAAVLSRSVMSDSLRPHGLWPARFLCPRDSPGKKTGVGSHSLLHRIFLTQGLNLGLLYCRQILYHLSHQGSPLLK